VPGGEAKEVQVARINARQAIMVALISAATGIMATVLGTGMLWRDPEPEVIAAEVPVQHWLTIMEVGFFDQAWGDVIDGVRTVVEVNGRAISYPTRVLTAEPGPGMSEETFVLESSDEYGVRVEVLAVSVDGEVWRYVSQEVDVFGVSQLPVEATYDLYHVDAMYSRVPTPLIWVKFRITDHPD